MSPKFAYIDWVSLGNMHIKGINAHEEYHSRYKSHWEIDFEDLIEIILGG